MSRLPEVLAGLGRLPAALAAKVEAALRLIYWRGFLDGALAGSIAVLAVLTLALLMRRFGK